MRQREKKQEDTNHPCVSDIERDTPRVAPLLPQKLK